MRRLLLIAAVASFACGPSEAQKAAESCRTAFAAKDWHAAEVLCEHAAKLNPQDHQLALYQADASMYDYMDRLDTNMTAIEEQFQREREIAAQEAQAAAQERAARAAAYDAIINGKNP